MVQGENVRKKIGFECFVYLVTLQVETNLTDWLSKMIIDIICQPSADLTRCEGSKNKENSKWRNIKHISFSLSSSLQSVNLVPFGIDSTLFCSTSQSVTDNYLSVLDALCMRNSGQPKTALRPFLVLKQWADAQNKYLCCDGDPVATMLIKVELL